MTDNNTHISHQDNGDLISLNNHNGDKVRLHVSRFHGLIVTANRKYSDKEERSETTAYFGDPQILVDWLASHGYIPTQGHS